MRARATAWAKASLVNAIPCGLGAALSLPLPARVTVETTGEGEPIEVECPTDPGLVRRCVAWALGRAGCREGARASVDSEVPVARGLASSSAVSNAATLAAFGAAGRVPGDLVVLNGAIDASIAEGVSVTGAFDDAYVSYFGGAVATDNLRRRVVAALPLPPGLAVVLLIPPNEAPTARADVGALRRLSERSRAAWELTLANPARGMTLNGLIVCEALGIDPSPIREAEAAGALGASLSGTGSSFAALCKAEGSGRVLDAWGERDGEKRVLSINYGRATLEAPSSKPF